MKIKPIFDITLDLGEGPQYDDKRKTLLFVDITGKRWFEADLNTESVAARKVQGEIGAVVNIRPGEFLGLVKEGLAELNPEGGYKVIDHFLSPSERMNDAKSDAVGRIWAGSTDVDFARGRGKLFRFDTNRKRTTILTNLTLPNGLGWSPDNKTFYLIDSFNYVLWAFDFELSKGEISNQREFYSFLPTKGLPDGICVDSEGNIFIAMWGGGTIEVISARGQHIKSLRLPVSKPTSCALTGIEGFEIIVTTSSQGVNRALEPLGGKLLALSGALV